MNWNDLYTLFTEKIDPGARQRVLEAIADPERKIITGRFYGDGGGCLFAVAHVAALGTDFSALFGSQDKLAAMSGSLGLSDSEIVEGVRLWDSGGVKPGWLFSRGLRKNKADLCRVRFRERIRRHLERRDHIPAVEVLTQLPA